MALVTQFFKTGENEKKVDSMVESKSETTSQKSDSTGSSSYKLPRTSGGDRLAVHCVHGLGRAPLLVAIALVNLKLAPKKAIDLIRKRRTGALTEKQVNYVMNLQPLEPEISESDCCSNCVIF